MSGKHRGVKGKIERCVKSVSKQGREYEPYAVCKSSIGGKMKRNVGYTGNNGSRSRFRRKNGEEGLAAAQELSRKFHGRDNRETIELMEEESYPDNLAVLGDLVELQVLSEDGRYSTPINFKGMGISLTGNPKGTQLYFIGGNQKLPLDDLEVEEFELNKQYIPLGRVWKIAYFADKHHLTGPKQQKNGMEYEHEFGEEGGELPYLVYDKLNKKMILSGGSYTIEPEGIAN